MMKFELTVDSSLTATIERIVKEKGGESTPIQITRAGNKFSIDIDADISAPVLLEIRNDIMDILDSKRLIGSFRVV